PHRHLPSSPTRRSSDLRRGFHFERGLAAHVDTDSTIIGEIDLALDGRDHDAGRYELRRQDRHTLEKTAIEGNVRELLLAEIIARSEEHTSELQSRENLV